jgi:hypothetical protein
MTALRLPLTLAAMFFGSLGAALGLYAAAFIGVGNDIDPFMRSVGRRCSLHCCRFLGHRAPN